LPQSLLQVITQTSLWALNETAKMTHVARKYQEGFTSLVNSSASLHNMPLVCLRMQYC